MEECGISMVITAMSLAGDLVTGDLVTRYKDHFAAVTRNLACGAFHLSATNR